MKEKDFIQGTLFEDDYLVRTLGNLGTQPEIALTELVANAWDAGATQVDIYIPEEKGQKLTIQDNGTGIAPENLEKIFEYGYSTSEVGMGFGLYWAKDFVEGIGGSIHIDSVLQKGTTFTIKLPIKSANIIVLNS